MWLFVDCNAWRRGIDLTLAHRAACWRLGTAWQSAIRTVYVIAALRHEHDLDVRYHLYPHVELRVDGWSVPESGIAEHAFRILMPNEYEANKVDPRLIFGGSGIELHDLVVSPRQQRGRVWLPKAREITGLAGALRESRSSPQLALLG